jgi:basic amino acid/polyamine antiporter, APA family
VLFLALFGRRARVVDELIAAQDPEVLKLRGRNPLVLVPIANPSHAPAMVAVAGSLVPPQVGRVMLLSVVVPPPDWNPQEAPGPLANAQAAMRSALVASFGRGVALTALTTVARLPWPEIARVANLHQCEILLLGLSDLSQDTEGGAIGTLMDTVRCDVVVLRAPEGWDPDGVRRVTVPVGGRGGHDRLRARLLGSLFRTGTRTVRYVRVFPAATPDPVVDRARRQLRRVAEDEAPGQSETQVVRDDDAVGAIATLAADSDLLILGTVRLPHHRRAFGRFTLAVAGAVDCPILMIARRL